MQSQMNLDCKRVKKQAINFSFSDIYQHNRPRELRQQLFRFSPIITETREFLDIHGLYIPKLWETCIIYSLRRYEHERIRLLILPVMIHLARSTAKHRTEKKIRCAFWGGDIQQSMKKVSQRREGKEISTLAPLFHVRPSSSFPFQCLEK